MILSALLIFVFHKKLASLAKTSLIGSGLIGVVFILYACIYGGFYGLETKKLLWKVFESDQKDLSAFKELGTEQNVIIILWDGMEGKIVEEIFAENPNAKNKFDGFMFFPNAIGSAPLTWRALPTIYSGKFHVTRSANFKIIRKIMYTDSFFLDAKRNGFRVASRGLKPTISIGGFESFESFYKNNDRMSDSYLIKYLLFLNACQKRVTPLIFQRLFSPLINTFRMMRERDAKTNKRNAIRNGGGKKNRKEYYVREIQKDMHLNELRKGAFSKKLLYYHSIIPHEPYIADFGAGYSKEHAKAVFSYILLDATPYVFSKLKELEIYDSSLIFVISDHGARMPETSEGIKVGKSTFELSYTGNSRFPAGAYNPLLMVKPPFAKETIKISNNPAMLIDIKKVILNYMQGGNIYSETLFNLDKINKREIKLIVTINPKTEKSLDTHAFLKFSGSLQDIPDHL